MVPASRSGIYEGHVNFQWQVNDPNTRSGRHWFVILVLQITYSSCGFIGVTLHWIHVDGSGKWSLKSAVIGMHGLSGNHGGKNMGRYIVGLCDRVGLIGKVRVACDQT
jgi:hypothetical protein